MTGDFFSIYPQNGSSGVTNLQITTGNWSGLTERTGSFLITASKYGYTSSVTVNVLQLPEAHSISVSPNSAVFAASGGSESVQVSASHPWSATSSDGFISVSPSTGNAGTSNILIMASSNSGLSRTGTVVISDGVSSTTVSVSQNEHYFSVSPNLLNFAASGGSESVQVSASHPWTATSSDGFISVSPSAGTAGTSNILIMVSSNSGAVRTGDVTISDTISSSVVDIRQTATAYTLTISPTALTFDIGGDTQQVTIDSLTPWTASTNSNLLTLSSVSGASGTSVLTITSSSALTSDTAVVTITNGVDTVELNVSFYINYSSRPLTFIAQEDGVFSCSRGIYYSIDNGANWVFIYENTDTPTVHSGESIMWAVNRSGEASDSAGTFWSSGKFIAEGNVMSVKFGNGNGLNQTNLSGYTKSFYRLFYRCSGLTSAENLSIPATMLSGSCYEGMFQYCTSLTTAPELPATTLGNLCYGYMFWGCTSLTTAPELPITTLASSCYTNMFRECTSLTTAPELPATTLTNDCYAGMFAGCTNLTTAPELPATTLAIHCYDIMFWNCTSLTTAPELPATTLAQSCYHQMFHNCTGLTTAPFLPAPTLVYGCYNDMFWGCTNLNCVLCLAESNINAGTGMNGTTEGWLRDVSPTGVFGKSPNVSLGNSSASGSTWPRSINGIPSGWTVQNVYSIPSTSVRGVTSSVCGSTESFRVISSKNWSASTSESWISLSQSTGNAGIVNMSITIFPSSGTYRFGSVVFTDGDSSSTISVFQDTNDQTQVYFKTTSLVDNNTIEFTIYRSQTDATSISYTTDGNNWITTNVDGSVKTISISGVSNGQTILWKGIANKWDKSNFKSTGNVKVSGNIMSLLYGDNYIGEVNLYADNTFYTIFGFGGKLISAENLALPATSLTNNCYTQMFSGCTSLTTAPSVLPATTLADSCYYGMFSGCTSLTTAPSVLPATTLAGGCYQYMFYHCTSLTMAPELPATTLAIYCCRNMFEGCTSLTTAPSVLPATTLAQECYAYMFYNCTSLTTAPSVLSATTLAENCCWFMFAGCSSLTTAPELPATTFSNRWGDYANMFMGCTSLNYIKCLATSGIAQNSSTERWVQGVSSTGTFVKNASTPVGSGTSGQYWPRSINGIPSGWTVQDAT